MKYQLLNIKYRYFIYFIYYFIYFIIFYIIFYIFGPNFIKISHFTVFLYIIALTPIPLWGGLWYCLLTTDYFSWADCSGPLLVRWIVITSEFRISGCPSSSTANHDSISHHIICVSWGLIVFILYIYREQPVHII